MIIDGRLLAEGILESARASLPSGTRPVVRAIVVSPSVVTRSYLRIKAKAAATAGMVLEAVELPADADAELIISTIEESDATAVLVQLPLPAHLNEQLILSHIPAEKDADVLSTVAHENGILLAPVAGAVKQILSRAGIDPSEMEVVVVGEGKLVGAPVAVWLKEAGAHVNTFNDQTFSSEEAQAALRAADIIVSGAGVPNLITPDMVKEGVALIDAGTSEQEGAVVGDIDPACAPKARVFTPVPGGVGPVTVACLFQNVALLQAHFRAERPFDEAISEA